MLQKDEINMINKKDEMNMIDKIERIKSAPIGTVVAFRSTSGAIKSAKIVHISTRDEMLKIETKYKEIYLVPFMEVLWVKTGTRWPKFIYEAFKRSAHK